MKEDTETVKKQKNVKWFETIEPKKKTRKKTLRTTEDYMEVISWMIQLIKEDPNPLDHSGRLASLVNAWSGLYRLDLETKDVKDILERLEILESQKR